MSSSNTALVDQIKLVNRGRGVRQPTLTLGPALSAALRLEPSAGDDEARRAVMVAWRHGADSMPPDLGAVLLAVSAISYGNPHISGRVQHIADQQRVSARTVWRRYDAAVDFLAQSLLATSGGDVRAAQLGFYVLDFSQIADYTGERPVWVTQRTIRVTAPELGQIVDTIGFPRWEGDEPEYRCLQGCELAGTEHPFAATWEYRLRLPKILHAGDLWEYSVSVRVPNRDCLEPLAALVANRETHRASVEVWFGAGSPVSQVWSLEGIPALALHEANPVAPLVAVGADGRVQRSYQGLQPGRGYGLRWQWPDQAPQPA